MKNNLNSNHRKDWKGGEAIICIHVPTRKVVLEIRTYCPGSRVYACAWLTCGGHTIADPATGEAIANCYASGSGHASGYGYNKRNAAIREALHAMGVPYKWFEKHGDPESDDTKAIEALLNYMGFFSSDLLIIKSHA